MRLVLVGPPGAGKGTQAHILAERFSIPHIATGDIFRANLKEGTPLGIQAKQFMDKGELVPDSLTNEMVADRLTRADAAGGFLLDGFPRNVAQAEVLKANLLAKQSPLDAVLELQIEDSEIIARLSSRTTCRSCGAPALAGEKCPSCGGELYQRDDDKEDVIKRRLEVYKEQTSPIIAFYRSEGLLKTIQALGSVEEITARSVAALAK